MRTASCLCGQLTATVEGDPVRVSVCHCRACQRRSGSVFATQARFPRAALTSAGRAHVYTRTNESGSRAHFTFCPDCGGTVYYTLESEDTLVAVPVGTFAEPAFPPPVYSVYESSKHAWVTLPDGIEHWD